MAKQPKAAARVEILQIKVKLKGTKPPIWRRVLVPSTVTLEQLHLVLQAAMGWLDYHLYEFRAGDKRYGPESDESDSSTTVSAVLGKAKAKAAYLYDFGDDWEHELVVEKVTPPEPGRAYPVCVDGKLACPPEDCGGVPGFYELLNAAGEDYDPKWFSVEEVNKLLAPAQEVYA